MRALLSIIAGLMLNLLMAWIVIGPFHTHNVLGLAVVVLLFGIPNLGTFWMLYVSIRHEKRPLPYVVLAFIPYSFIWYYATRVRTGKNLSERRFEPK